MLSYTVDISVIFEQHMAIIKTASFMAWSGMKGRGTESIVVLAVDMLSKAAHLLVVGGMLMHA